jgi:hypothetical protein
MGGSVHPSQAALANSSTWLVWHRGGRLRASGGPQPEAFIELTERVHMRLNSSCGALVGVVVTVVAGLASASPSLAPRVHGRLDRRLSDSTSTNWSGYAVTGGTYTSAASSWTVPTLACTQSAEHVLFVLGRARRRHNQYGRADRDRGGLQRHNSYVLRLV